MCQGPVEFFYLRVFDSFANIRIRKNGWSGCSREAWGLWNGVLGGWHLGKEWFSPREGNLAEKGKPGQFDQVLTHVYSHSRCRWLPRARTHTSHPAYTTYHTYLHEWDAYIYTNVTSDHLAHTRILNTLTQLATLSYIGGTRVCGHWMASREKSVVPTQTHRFLLQLVGGCAKGSNLPRAW